MQQPMQNPEDISDPITALDMALELMSKAFQLNNTTTTNNNQISLSKPCYNQIAQSGMNIDQDRQMLMVDDNVGNYVVPGIANQHGNGNVVAARDEGNSNEINGNQIRCYNCRGEGHYASNCTEFDFMAAAGAYDEIEKVTANCTLQDNLQHASTSGTQSDKAPVYDSDGSAEVHHSENYYDNDIFNMFIQEEYMEQGDGTVELHSATIEETRAYHESLFHNLVAEVEKVNSVNRKMKETNAELTTELARYKNQVKCFEISQEKYDKLERCYQRSIYQEQCLTKKINALHLSSGKQITTLNEEISNLNNQISKEKSTVSSHQEEKKRFKSDFKIREDELLDKQIQLENKIKELDNILVKTAQQKQQSLYNGKVILEKHDTPAVYNSEETLELAQESRLKMKQLNFFK
ncbi:integrase, catalytic region, zinc finger, CCHC-type containing protein [Tanacetum coccineum]